MINRLQINNFKSLKNINLHLGNLTVLSGQNGVGKSSVIQSLLLLRQTHYKNRLDKILDLNAPLCYIGRSKDAIYKYPNEDFENQIGFVLVDENLDYSWVFEDQNSENATFLKRKNEIDDSEGYEQLSLFNENFQYLSAYRNNDYLVDDYAVEFDRQISIFEGKGELLAQFLNQYGKKQQIIASLKHEKESDDFLLSQVTSWEREISKNVNVKPIQHGDGFDIRYSFDTQNKLGPTDDILKKNVGFGLSYALPIITAILSAKKGALLLIENPEAHIHPYGISKITELICRASQAGIQIVLETHSDHIINGILVQCRQFETSKGQHGINKESVKIYYFDRTETNHETISHEIKIGERGSTENRVEGFFDQIGKDLRNLF